VGGHFFRGILKVPGIFPKGTWGKSSSKKDFPLENSNQASGRGAIFSSLRASGTGPLIVLSERRLNILLRELLKAMFIEPVEWVVVAGMEFTAANEFE